MSPSATAATDRTQSDCAGCGIEPRNADVAEAEPVGNGERQRVRVPPSVGYLPIIFFAISLILAYIGRPHYIGDAINVNAGDALIFSYQHRDAMGCCDGRQDQAV